MRYGHKTRSRHIGATACAFMSLCLVMSLAACESDPMAEDLGAGTGIPLNPAEEDKTRIILIAPSPLESLDRRWVSVKFSIAGQPGVSWTIYGGVEPVTGTLDGSVAESVEAHVNLPIGKSNLNVRVFDDTGLADSVSVPVFAGIGAAPIVRPDELSVLTNASLVTLNGAIDTDYILERAVATISGTETELTLEPSETGVQFTGQLAVSVGLYEVSIQAVDGVGRTGIATITVERTAQGSSPVITPTFPTDLHSIRSRVATFHGQISHSNARPMGPYSVEVITVEQTVSGTVSPDGRYSVSVPLSPGWNDVTLRATDAAGANTTLEQSVYMGQRLGAGGAHGGLIEDGQLYTWGRNNKGQTGLGYLSYLGDTNPAHPHSPTPVDMPTTPASVAFAQNASLVLDTDGGVWSFGDNTNGQLCLGDSGEFDEEDRWVPTKVDIPADVVAVIRGYSHSMMLTWYGTVWTCGKNADGQLGDGTTEARDRPTIVSGLPPVVQISAGSASSYAIDVDGNLWAWGRNKYANLGQGDVDTEPHPIPVQVPIGEPVISVANGRDHVLALTESGIVYAWGLNASTQVGPDMLGGDVETPVIVEGITDAVAVYASGNQGFYEDTAGKLYGWGQNGSGNLGIDTDADQSIPNTAVFGVDSVVDAVIGPLQGFAMRDDGAIFAWGWSFEGSLGAGPDAIDAWSYQIPIPVALDE